MTNPPVGAITSDSFLQDLFRDDELHDLAGPRVDLRDLRVAIMSLGREVFQVSVAAEDLHTVSARLDRDVTRKALRFGGGEDVVLTRLLHRRRAPREQAGGV